MFRDIHQWQYLDKDKRIAYPSSLVQQNFGESPDKHGFIEWQIENANDYKSIFHEIKNDQNLINLYFNENIDYDNIIINTPYNKLINTQSELKVHWSDYSANINLENEQKIREHLINTYNVSKIKFDKTHLYNDITQSEIINESININDKTLQQSIFREYLKLNKYDEDFIDEIIKIDDIINERMNLAETISNVQWNIDKFWLENFKAFDKFEIDWRIYLV